MKIIEAGNFNKVNDPVKTEEILNLQLIQKADHIHTDYSYVALPLAWNINHQGVPNTQKQINDICNAHVGEKLFFICQHILVDRLNFHGNLVFTPHATILDSFIPIPHHSCNYDLKKAKSWSERQYEFSFMGSFITHPVRRRLYQMLKDRDDCFMEDTGGWHFEGSVEKQAQNREKYIEILGNTKYSLCPRGTGPSTIRIWEAMAMGSCPIILSDYLKMPLKWSLKTNLWFNIPEKCDIIDVDQKAYDAQEYWEWFSNENLYRSILSVLKG